MASSSAASNFAASDTGGADGPDGPTGSGPSSARSSWDDPGAFDDPASFDRPSGFDDPPGRSDAALVMGLAKEWVRQHQTVAMLGAFAVGTFLGVMLRD